MPVEAVKPHALDDGDMEPVSVASAAILAAANVGIAFTNLDGRVEYANEAACRKLGVPTADVLGRHIDELSHEAWKHFQEIIRTGAPQIGVKTQTSGGTVIADRTPVLDGRRVVGIVSIFKDLAEYEETAKQLQVYRDLAKQLEGVIHSSYDGLY